MGFIKKEDVVAYLVDDQIFCEDCFSEDDEVERYYTESDFAEADDEIIVCDKCGKTIWS